MKDLRDNRSLSILMSIAVYGIAGLAAIIAGGAFSHLHPLLMIFYADIAATVVVFLFSVILNNSSAYDPYWSVKPPFIAAVYIYLSGPDAGIRAWIAFFLLLLYGIRLTLNFYRGWTGFRHEDWRYRNFREQFPGAYWVVSFAGIHLFPTLMVYLGCLPLYAIYLHQDGPLTIPDYAGILVLFLSVVLAWLADKQLHDFRKQGSADKQLLDSGLWSVSRHPNYLGEILTWWGLFMLGLGAGLEYWWTGAGALAISLMFIFVSIPMIEQRHLERRAGYQEYRNKVPMLLPFLKKG